MLQARYRDIRFGLRYTMPFWLYATTIIYPVTTIPGQCDGSCRSIRCRPLSRSSGGARWRRPLDRLDHHVAGTDRVALITGIWFFNREESASIDKL